MNDSDLAIFKSALDARKELILEAVVIEKGATNGEVMQKTFDISLNDFKRMWGGGIFTDDWWNAPYKEAE